MLPIADFERGGVVLDSDPFALALNEWSDCRNVRFDNRSVSKITGEDLLLTFDNVPVVVFYWERPADQRYVYVANNGRTYLVQPNGTEQEITKGFSTTRDPLTISNNITITQFNGGASLVINDGAQTPQFINAPGVGQTNTQELVDLPDWIPANSAFSTILAGTIRSFGNVLVASNLTLTETGGRVIRAPGTIRVSNLAARGSLPTWNATYAGATSGDQFDLSTNSPVVDMVPFQDSLGIYTGNSFTQLRLTGNSSLPVTVTPGTSGRGMLTDNCAIEYQGTHYVVGSEDIYANSGSTSQPTFADQKVKDYFFRNLNRDAENITHVVHNRRQEEIWILYPKGSSTTCNEILIYNYDNKTWTIRDANNIVSSVYGGSKNSDDTAFVTNNSFVVMASSNRTVLRADQGTFFYDTTATNNEGAINSFVERRGIDIVPTATNVKKWVDSTYYIIRGSGDVLVQARATDTPGRPVNFSSTTDRYLKNRTFRLDPDMGDYKVDSRDAGRYYNTRISTNDTTSNWSLIRYNLAFSVDDER